MIAEPGSRAPIETRSLGEQVYRHLCDLIIDGRIDYGETINSKLLAQEMNVSPMPVREALKRLSVEGLVVIKPRSMCTLRVPTRKSVLDAMAMRELFEVYCVQSVYRTVETERLERLREITRTMESLLPDGAQNLRDYIRHDGQFHVALCALASNDFIDKSYRELSLHLNMNHTYNIAVEPDVRRTFRDHLDLVDALSRHSPDAVKIIKGHLARSRSNVMKGRLFKDARAPRRGR